MASDIAGWAREGSLASPAETALSDGAGVAAAAAIVGIADECGAADALSHAAGVARGTAAEAAGTAFGRNGAAVAAASAILIVVDVSDGIHAASLTPILAHRATGRATRRTTTWLGSGILRSGLVSPNLACAGPFGTLLPRCACVATGAAIELVLAEVQAASAAIGLVRFAVNPRFAIADGAGFSLLAGVSTTPAVAEILAEVGAGGAALAFRRRTG